MYMSIPRIEGVSTKNKGEKNVLQNQHRRTSLHIRSRLQPFQKKSYLIKVQRALKSKKKNNDDGDDELIYATVAN